ncbi:MAG: hypothetical protein ACOX3U_07295 [Christensenellales bacterium]|jgi:hypothetical protein
MANMTKITKIIILITVMALVLAGCNRTSIKYGKQYTEYAFVGDEGAFVPTGRYLTLNRDDTFTMIFDEDLTLTGEAEHIDREYTVYLDCDENTSLAVKEMFKQRLINDPDNILDIEIIDQMLEGMTISEEMHYYKKYIFSTNFISAHRYVDTNLYQYGEDYGKFEGVYTVKQYDGLMLLKHGEIFVQDTVNPKPGEFPVYKGTYIYGNDFITMTINDEDGNPQPPQKYLVAELTIPYDLRPDDSLSPSDDDAEKEEWYEMIEDQLEQLKGKKIKVLVLCFYTRNKM